MNRTPSHLADTSDPCQRPMQKDRHGQPPMWVSIVMAQQASRNEQATPTRWLITPNPADLSRVLHQRLVWEYAPFAAACLKSHNAEEA